MTTSENAQRDELARDIFIADNSAHPNAGAEWDAFEDIGGVCGGGYAYGIADGLLAAGYRKPRTITTVEELDTLPVGSVVLDAKQCPFQQAGDCWHVPGDEDCFDGAAVELPATLLWAPELAEAA